MGVTKVGAGSGSGCLVLRGVAGGNRRRLEESVARERFGLTCEVDASSFVTIWHACSDESRRVWEA